MRPILEIKPLLENAPGKITITMHQKPDADAMGASLALYHYLLQKGHTVQVISPTNFPDFLKWMPGCDRVINFEADQAFALEALKDTRILFCLDFNTFRRTHQLAPHLEQLNCVKALIDHHQEPDPAFDYGISNTAAAATAQLIYEFIVAMGDSALINGDIARCIYAGTMTDTGSFRFASTSAAVHRMVADLMDRGLEHEPIHHSIYDNYLENRFRFIGYVLQNRFEVFYDYNTAMIAIPHKDIKRFDLKTGDTEGLVNYPLAIQGIRLAALIIGWENDVKLSFRSKGDFDVNRFARRYFQGGGHKNAAGGHSQDSLADTVERFKQAIRENKDLLK
ncbi:DHH family phosphoesterase [Compostibacter hankyongensis]|uniref:Bifunctional oligoribonuclease/PAP phosphatase NrnA n=1 Tax=Compostibacter hankyongensis TaxID=1007089 RepID=A0ABP8FN33_9BACT